MWPHTPPTKTNVGHLALRALVIVAVAVCPAACSGKERPAISEATFFGPQGLCGFSREDFGRVDIAAVEGWIKAKHGGVEFTSQDKYGESTITLLTWGNGAEYGSAKLRDNVLISIVRYGINFGFTFEDVVSAFGAPTWVYRAYEAREQVLYAVDLEYPARGLAVGNYALVPVTAIEHNGRWAVQLREDMQVNTVICHLPVTSFEAFVQLIKPGADVTIQVERRIAWPGFGVWIPLDATP